jgi:hypothetical protein
LDAHRLPVIVEISAASAAASSVPLRPKQPAPSMNTRRMASRGSPVIAVSSCCIECVACDDVHTVSLPSLKSATAHDGPIVACVCTAKS